MVFQERLAISRKLIPFDICATGTFSKYQPLPLEIAKYECPEKLIEILREEWRKKQKWTLRLFNLKRPQYLQKIFTHHYYRTRVYQRLVRPYHLGHVLVAPWRTQEIKMHGLTAFSRSKQFTQEELELAELLEPWICQAWQNFYISRKLLSFEKGFEMFQCGIILTDEEGRIIEFNTQAKKFLDKFRQYAKKSSHLFLPDLLKDLLKKWLKSFIYNAEENPAPNFSLSNPASLEVSFKILDSIGEFKKIFRQKHPYIY